MSEVLYSRGASAPRRLFIAIPTYTGQLPARVVMALTQSVVLMHAAGIRADICIESANCHVDDTRNSLLRQFLLSDCDDLLFIDADVAWRPDELLRFLGHRRDVVAGVYPKKRDGEDYPVREIGGALVSDASGLVEVAGVPTGFLKLSREAIERVSERCSRTYYGTATSKDDAPYRIVFERTWEPLEGQDYGLRHGGDYSFCMLWREMGGRIWVDPEMTFDHEGTHRWTGKLADFWRERHTIDAQALQDALQGLSGGPPAYDKLIEAWNNPIWTATPDLIRAVIQEADAGTGPILECGSGLTTLVLAAVTDRPILSLEHDPRWAQWTAARVNACGLGGDRVRIVCAPLTEGDAPWYDFEPEEASMVVIDGPPREFGRGGVVEHIRRLRPTVVIVDDVTDPEQSEMADVIAGILDVDMTVQGKVGVLSRHEFSQKVA